MKWQIRISNANDLKSFPKLWWWQEFQIPYLFKKLPKLMKLYRSIIDSSLQETQSLERYIINYSIRYHISPYSFPLKTRELYLGYEKRNIKTRNLVLVSIDGIWELGDYDYYLVLIVKSLRKIYNMILAIHSNSHWKLRILVFK